MCADVTAPIVEEFVEFAYEINTVTGMAHHLPVLGWVERLRTGVVDGTGDGR